MTWQVKIVEKGRYGQIEYVEDGQICRCDWELGGGDTLAILLVPAPDDWNANYPWAKGRRQEVLNRVVSEVRRQRAPSASIEWDEARNCIYLKERRRRE